VEEVGNGNEILSKTEIKGALGRNAVERNACSEVRARSIFVTGYGWRAGLSWHKT
jgi:hypothetical protein